MLKKLSASLLGTLSAMPAALAANTPTACNVKFRDVADLPFPIGKSLVMKSCDGEPIQNLWDQDHTYMEAMSLGIKQQAEAGLALDGCRLEGTVVFMYLCVFARKPAVDSALDS